MTTIRRTGLLIGLAMAAALLWPVQATAEGLRGFLEYSYGTSETETRDSATGEKTMSETSSFLQRYNLLWERRLFPHLTLSAGGLFERTDSDRISDDLERDSSLTRISPFADLLLNNSFLSAGAGYRRRMETSSSEGTPSFTRINDIYTTSLGLRPEGFPTLDFLYTHALTYDEDRTFNDLASDYFVYSARYRLMEKIDLFYQGSFNTSEDRITMVENRSVTNSGRITYSDRFFDQRLSLYASNHVVFQDATTTTLFIVPFAGLAAIGDTPDLIHLESAPALIDGNTSSGIGPTGSIGVQPVGGDTRPRHLGLDLINRTSLNALRVVVAPLLEREISDRFSWDVYTSDDNLTWTFRQTAAATFGTFLGPTGVEEHRFELTFAPVETRYIKVVVRPLPLGTPGTGPEEIILVTELQALDLAPAEGSTRRSTSSFSDILDVNSRFRILDVPYLTYDFSLFANYSENDLSSRSRAVIGNGLSLSHRFNRAVNVSSRIAREDTLGEEENGTAYVYSASLGLTPLPTLSHTLIFSGRLEDGGEDATDSHSVFLNNYAELYRGVSVAVTGGLSRSQIAFTGQETESAILTLGANLVPHPTLSLNLSHSSTRSRRSGENLRETVAQTDRSELAASFRPYEALYFFGSVALTSQDDRDSVVTQNYGGTWAPFRTGTLLVNLTLSETLSSDGGQRNRTIIPNLRWTLRPGWYLDAAYMFAESTLESTVSETHSFNTTFRLAF